MRTIRFGLSRPIKQTLFARAIMWADKTNYDHVYVRWTWAAIGRDIIYQASKMAVNFETDVTFEKHAITVKQYEVDLDEVTHTIIMQFCMDNSNKPYSLMQILGFVYVNLVKIVFRAKVHNPFPTHMSSFVCSKMSAYIASMIGIKISTPFDDIDPLDFEKIMEAAVAQGLVRRVT